MQLTVGIGKLSLGGSVRTVVETQITRSAMALLPITLDHIDALSRLPNHHRDPFSQPFVSCLSHDRGIVRSAVTVRGGGRYKTA